MKDMKDMKDMKEAVAIAVFPNLKYLEDGEAEHPEPSQVRAGCDICLSSRYFKLEKPASRCLTMWPGETQPPLNGTDRPSAATNFVSHKNAQKTQN